MSAGVHNVVLLTVDALRADHLSGYGYPRSTSPTLNRLAERGVRFTAAYSGSSHTRESIPALLTGRPPDAVVGPNYRLEGDTVAGRLDDADPAVATGGFHSNPFTSRAYGYGRDFDAFDDDLALGAHRFLALAQRLLDKLRNRHYAPAEVINERSLDWLDGVGDQPWLLWNHYMDVHGPYEPPAEYRREFCDSVVDGRTAQRLYRRAIRDPESIDAADRATLVDCYDAEIRSLDDRIGQFVDALEGRGLLSDTLVVITADHGEAFGERGYYEHPRYLHDELVHVPTIAFGAGIGQGTVSVPVGSVDVVPTILDALGLPHGNYPGTPLQTVATDPSAVESRFVYSQATGEGEERGRRRFSVRDGSAVCYLERDLESGAIVERDRNGAPARLVAALERYSASRLMGPDRTASDPDTGDATGAIADRLEALGYREG